MRVKDLGSLKGEVLVFGGPCSNLQATQAFVDVAAARGVAASNCICTGDVVAYCADAAATVAAIRHFGCPVVAGNCEKQLAAGAASCGCGFDEGTVCDLLSAGWYAHGAAQMRAQERDWMNSLPDVLTFRHAGRRIAVLHGGATDVARFLWPSSDAGAFLEEIAALEAAVGQVDQVIAGHSGLAFARDIGRVRWINAGAIGMPPHDGRPQTRFARLSGGGVTFHRLVYDVDSAVAAMRAAGLTQGYDAALTTGIWPSEDVLPVELRH
ncbi:MAG: metallophosphoesterase family protein [Rhodobacter sp.]|nr:metallophosphoesterase family protein [Rhodobacter sp.]